MATVKGLRIQINSDGAKALLQSAAVQADLMGRAQSIAAAAGGEEAGFVAEPSVSPDRASAQVITTTYAARAREARDRTLTRAIDAGR
ncbi:hypothetical protein [Microbacterium sp. No. 7]|uniref:hypothetical protein n=1 Tax=Microbacterium sp. No. 7 TaxID=1714373 RepID=UPI0006D14FDE|nr:hypothetical protein [Microbacterium sp. No. 7]ALJ20380.1 hypothetical protein AOA12_10845 [Microbacterium sp. No. 7]